MNRNWKFLSLALNAALLLVCSNLVVGVACGNQTQSTTTDQADTTTKAKKKSITDAADQAPKSAPASTPAASTTPAAKPAASPAASQSPPQPQHNRPRRGIATAWSGSIQTRRSTTSLDRATTARLKQGK